MMNRRDLLKSVVGASCAACAFAFDNPLRPRFRMAQAATGKTLVVVFQRGGCDGLNTVVPYGDDEYYKLRPTIAIAPPNAGDPEAAIPLSDRIHADFFGLHPALAAFDSIYQAGDLAVMPTVHYPEASRSHFDGQAFIESADTLKTADGWLNRHLSTSAVAADLRAVGFGGALPQALKGPEIVSAFNNLTHFDLGLPEAEADTLLQNLGPIYGQVPDLRVPYQEPLHEFGRVLVHDLDVVRQITALPYAPANGAVYPNSGLGTQMRQTAQLIKAGVGLEIAALSIGGWDTHGNQGGGNTDGVQARRFADFAGSLAAFYDDLGSLMQDVLVLTMTEFGRTAKENGSRDTDHGNAATWLAMGGAVTGGIYGAWPGLREEQLYRGRYLSHTIDYRDVLGEVLTKHLGNGALNFLLPGHAYQPVGFLMSGTPL